MPVIDAIWVILAASIGFALALGVNYLILDVLLKAMQKFRA